MLEPQMGTTSDDLKLASMNYWAGRTGREIPPAATYRMVGKKMMLGRYMDPYGCQLHMEKAQGRWRNWYVGFFITGASSLLFIEIDFWAMIIAGPLAVLYYFIMKGIHRRQFDLYYKVQNDIIRSGEPQWVPFDKRRLKLIDQTPRAFWP